ncbi:hypothetical protein L596_023248 [Steinernema carpocapsae]|nr:hypothetical protein L596_023248 [Steinernema carpocapsae]
MFAHYAAMDNDEWSELSQKKRIKALRRFWKLERVRRQTRAETEESNDLMEAFERLESRMRGQAKRRHLRSNIGGWSFFDLPSVDWDAFDKWMEKEKRLKKSENVRHLPHRRARRCAKDVCVVNCRLKSLTCSSKKSFTSPTTE